MMEREWGRENWVLQTKGGTGLGDEKLGWGSVREEGQGPGWQEEECPFLVGNILCFYCITSSGLFFFSLRHCAGDGEGDREAKTENKGGVRAE